MKKLTAILLAAAIVLTLCACARQYKITVASGTDLLDECPKRAEAGDVVTVKTASVTDGDVIVRVNGDAGFGSFVQEAVYEFTMPAQDVEISISFVSNGLA